MIPLSVFVSLALIPFTLAQSPTDVAFGIAAIEAHFSNAGIVPSMLATFTPSALMNVAFGAAVPPGTPLTQDRQSYQLFPIIFIESGLFRGQSRPQSFPHARELICYIYRKFYFGNG